VNIHYLTHKESIINPYPEPDESIAQLPTLSFQNPFRYDPIYIYVFQVISFLQIFRPKFCINFSSPSCVLIALPILSSFVTIIIYLVKSTSYEALHL